MNANTTTMSINKTTMQIIDVLKSRKKLPSMESVVQWLFTHLEKNALDEMKEIAGFLKLPPPLKNDAEIKKQHDYRWSKDCIDDTINELEQGFIASKLNNRKAFERNITPDDVISYIDERIEFLRSNGLASSRLESMESDDIAEVYNRLKKMNLLPDHE